LPRAVRRLSARLADAIGWRAMALSWKGQAK